MLNPHLSYFQNRVILYSTNITFDFMIIYVKRVLLDIGGGAFCRKNDQFHVRIWFVDKLWGHTKSYRGDFRKFDFSRIKVKIFLKILKIFLKILRQKLKAAVV